MSKIIGIDLGTHQQLRRRYGRRRARRHRQLRRARAPTPSVCRLHQDRRASGRPGRQAPGPSPTRENTISSIKRKMGTAEKVHVGGKDYTPEGDQRDDPVQAEGGRRGVSGRKKKSPRPSSPCPPYFNDSQRQATKNAGHHRRPQRAPYHQRADRRPRSLMASTRNPTRRSWSTTWAAAPSTSPSSRWATAVTEVLATNGDTHLGGDDFDQRIIDWMADDFQKGKTALTCARTRWRPSA